MSSGGECRQFFTLYGNDSPGCTNLQDSYGDEEGEQQLVPFEEASADVCVHIVGEEIVELFKSFVQIIAFLAEADALQNNSMIGG